MMVVRHSSIQRSPSISEIQSDNHHSVGITCKASHIWCHISNGIRVLGVEQLDFLLLTLKATSGATLWMRITDAARALCSVIGGASPAQDAGAGDVLGDRGARH